MFRPENWANREYGEDREIFEAGADAMLAGLRQTSDRIIDTPNENGFYDSVWGCFTCSGRLVFIPDEV